jgi:DNA polymerase
VSDKGTITEIVREACEVIRKSANARGNIGLSPETAARLEQIAARNAAPRVRERPPSPQGAAKTPGGKRTGSKTPNDCQTLEELEQLVNACEMCPLAKTRTNVVFGSGNPHARLVFVGEAPGAEEDRQGLPFVGRAGQLLTDIIEKGMNLKRSDVYICNVLKCRPPDNRNPLPTEIECCEPFLVRQLEIIKPKVICALGAFAAQTLLKTTRPIGQLRGEWHFYHGIPLRATYHPAYLLRNPADKRKTWMDVIEVMKVHNGEVEPIPND